MRRILEVAREHALTKSEVLGPTWTRRAIDARHEAMFRMVAIDRFSLQLAARLAGKRHHTTVLHAVRRYAQRCLGTRPDATLAEIRQAWAERQGAQA